MGLATEIGERIREIRADATQAHFASRVGVDRKTVVRWEAGELMPGPQSLVNIMQCYGVDANWLLCGVLGDRQIGVTDGDGILLEAIRRLPLIELEKLLHLLGLRRYHVFRTLDGTRTQTELVVQTDDVDEARSCAQAGLLRRVLDVATGRYVWPE